MSGLLHLQQLQCQFHDFSVVVIWFELLTYPIIVYKNLDLAMLVNLILFNCYFVVVVVDHVLLFSLTNQINNYNILSKKYLSLYYNKYEFCNYQI